MPRPSPAADRRVHYLDSLDDLARVLRDQDLTEAERADYLEAVEQVHGRLEELDAAELGVAA